MNKTKQKGKVNIRRLINCFTLCILFYGKITYASEYAFHIPIEQTEETRSPQKPFQRLSSIESHLSHRESYENNRQTEKGFSTELLNIIHDDIKSFTLSDKTNYRFTTALEQFKTEMENQVLSQGWEMPQLISFLQKNISEKKFYPYADIYVLVLEKFLERYTLSYPELLETTDILIDAFSIDNPRTYVSIATIQVTENIFNKYPLPDEKVSQIIDQLSSNVFHTNQIVRAKARETLAQIMNKSASRVLKQKNQETILRIVQHLENKNDHAIAVLYEFANQNVLQDDPVWNKIFSMIAEQLTNTSWQKRNKTILTLHTFLKKEIISDPALRRKYILMIKEQTLKEAPSGVKERYIMILRNFMEQNIPSDAETKQEIILTTKQELNEEDWKKRATSIQILSSFVKGDIFPKTEKMEIMNTIAFMVFDENWKVRVTAAKVIKSFWRSDLFSPSEKQEVMHKIAELFSYASQGKRRALKLLRAAAQAGLFIDFDTIYYIISRVSEPDTLGTKAENFVKKFQSTAITEDSQTLLIYLEMEEKISERRSLVQSDTKESGDCLNAVKI